MFLLPLAAEILLPTTQVYRYDPAERLIKHDGTLFCLEEVFNQR